MYTEKDLVRVAKRENNNKRPYLVVNCLQAKHVPAEPGQTLSMFDALAGMLAAAYRDERLLLVGFAETATAIGARLAIDLGSYYMQTTREDIEGAAYLYFTESHSHATEQKLVKTDLDSVIGEIDRIIFVEDEVTTGNTILKIISLIKKTYDRKIRFSVASLLNGMDKEAERVYRDGQIRTHYLVKTDHSSYTAVAGRFRGDGVYVSDLGERPMPEVKVIRAKHYRNGRRLVRGEDYRAACGLLWEQVSGHVALAGGGQAADQIALDGGESVLVLGTEEFMYPAIYVADQLGRAGCVVRCHATTRSPIAPSTEQEYPLHCRYELRSLYDPGRKTYVYDLGRYDKVIIITDAPESQSSPGIHDLCRAAAANGNEDIYVVRWCDR